MINPDEIRLFSIVNADGTEVILSNLGAGIVSVVVPDRDGKLADVVLGYHNPEDYDADGPCMGKVPGRFANRIAKGRFSLGGKSYDPGPPPETTTRAHHVGARGWAELKPGAAGGALPDPPSLQER